MGDYEDIVACVRQLSAGAVVEWGDDGEAPGGVLVAWLDVRAPVICDALDLNWAWEVYSPDAEDIRNDDTVIVLPYDVSREVGEPSVGWSPDAVNAALRRWCAEHAGRDDITFVYRDDLTSPFVQHLAEVLETDGERYDLGDGVFASDQAMDAFAADPDAAAEILSGFKQRMTDSAEPAE